MEDKYEKNQLDDKDLGADPSKLQDRNVPVLNKDNLKEYLGIQEKEKSTNIKDRFEYLMGQLKEGISNNTLFQEFKYFWTPKRIAIFVGVIIVIFLFFYFFAMTDQQGKASSQYRLVPEKLSKSAVIRISLPEGVDYEAAKKAVSFQPSIGGKWVEKKDIGFNYDPEAGGYKMVFFKPDKSLEERLRYEISLGLGDGKSMKADFLAVDDPKISAVFPDEKEEALESSELTVVFNRPMVSSDKFPVEAGSVPIETSPVIQGHYQWVTPNSLQIVPDKDLVLSNNYRVKVNEGFVSTDGLRVKGGEYSFRTRTVKYKDEFAERTITYNEPLRVYFNQAVDIKKISEGMKLYHGDREVPFAIRYADEEAGAGNSKKGLFDSVSELVGLDMIDLSDFSGNGNVIDDGIGGRDRSIIEVYNKTDGYDNKKTWIPDANYRLVIEKAYSSEGDIFLDQKKEISILTTSIVKDIKAYSSRTRYASPEVFDPSGYVIVDFYEDVDLSKCAIESPIGVKFVEYGERCSSSNASVSECQKTVDKKQLRIYFDQGKIPTGGAVNFSLKTITNTKGKKINPSPITESLRAYDELDFTIGKTFNKSNFSSLVICSNNPLSVPDEKDFFSHIKANKDYQINSWGVSWSNEYYKDRYCPLGSFVTLIDVSFLPKNFYELELSLEDVFGQKKEGKHSFHTEEMSDSITSIFAMQPDYTVTSPSKTSLSFGSQNIDYVDIEICKTIDPYGFYNSYSEKTLQSSNCQKPVSKRMDIDRKNWLPTYFTIDIEDYYGEDNLGNYVIKISNPQYKGINGGDAIYAFLNVTNLSVAEKRVDLSDSSVQENSTLFEEMKNIYWVTDMETKEPVKGAKVKIYASGKIVESFSDEKGLALVTPVAGFDVVVVEYGKDVAMIVNGDNINRISSSSSMKKSFIYTDRPYYELGDKVNIRGIIRLGYDGNYANPKGEQKVYITNPKGEKISEEGISLSDYGTFNTSFILDKDAPLGSYSVCTEGYSCGYFDVLENVAPAFELDISSTKDDYVSKEPIKIDIDAHYSFGVPVEGADVEYTVSAEDYYFDKASEKNMGFDDGTMNEGITTLFKGTTKLDTYGKGSIVEKLDLGDYFKNSRKSKEVTFDMRIRNSFGQAVSYKKTIVVHYGEFYLGLYADPYFSKKNDFFTIKAKSVDINGGPIAVKDISISIYKVGWKKVSSVDPDGRSLSSYVKERKFIRSVKGATNKNGDFSKSREAITEEGEYEIDLSATDKYGNTVHSDTFLYVFGDKQADIANQDGLVMNLKSLKTDLKYEEIGEVVIESPYPKAKALITIERGRVFDYQLVDIQGGLYSYKFKAKKEYFPNVYVSVLLQSQDSGIKYATKEFNVRSNLKDLKLGLTLDKRNYVPGERVEMRVATKDGNSTPVPAEVSIAVFSDDSLKDINNVKKDPFTFFYSQFPSTVSVFSNVKGNVTPLEMKRNVISSTHKNKDGGFRDMAIWKGDVVTNNEGFATISFKLPDKIANWHAEGIAITKDSEVGSSYIEFSSRREIMINPLKPKFILPGDSFYIGAEVINQTDKEKSVKVSFSSENLEFLGNNRETLLNVGSGDSQVVYFFVRSPLSVISGNQAFIINADIQNSDSVVSCSAKKNSDLVNGKCGTANGKRTPYVPTENLCSSGIPSEIEGEGPWKWTCEGSNGGKTVECGSIRNDSPIDGRCGTANNKKTAYIPVERLCAAGKASQVLDGERWTWNCEGINGGKPVACYAPKSTTLINGKCGSSHDTQFRSIPDDKLCESGNPSEVNISSWGWTCYGANGGEDADCAAKKPDISRNQCGSSNGKSLVSPPTTDLCSVGVPSQVSGYGPWTWTCMDANNSVQQDIPIKKNTLNKNMSILGVSSENKIEESIYAPKDVIPGKGGLSIRTSPTLLTFLASPIDFLIKYPYGSSEQLANRIKAIDAVKDDLGLSDLSTALKIDPIIRDGSQRTLEDFMKVNLDNLMKNQNSDGGFSMWGGSASDNNISVSVLESLIQISDSDKWKPDSDKMNSLVEYVYNRIIKDKDRNDDPDMQVSAAYALYDVPKYKNGSKSVMENFLKDESFLKDKLSTQSLLKLAIIVNRGGFSWGADGKINGIIDGRAKNDAQGVFLSADRGAYETDMGNTALYLKSLVVRKKDDQAKKVIQWLLNARSGDGSWGSTRDTMRVVQSMSDYISWKREKDSSYELRVSVNGEQLSSTSFSGSNLLEQTRDGVDMAKVKTGEHNGISFDKSNHRPLFKDPLYYDISFDYYTENNPPEDEGMSIMRTIHMLNDKDSKNPLYSSTVGSVLRVRLEVIIPEETNRVVIEDHIPAGMEIVDLDLVTEQRYLASAEKGVKNDYIYPDFKDSGEDSVILYKESLQPGVYEFDYYVRVTTKGNYLYLPAKISEMYDAQKYGKTEASYIEIK